MSVVVTFNVHQRLPNGRRVYSRPRPKRLDDLLGRTVSLRTAYGDRVGRLGLTAANGVISYEVRGLRFMGEIVRTVIDGLLPVVVIS